MIFSYWVLPVESMAFTRTVKPEPLLGFHSVTMPTITDLFEILLVMRVCPWQIVPLSESSNSATDHDHKVVLYQPNRL